MESKVKVLGDSLGCVIIQSNKNPDEYGYVRVEQTRIFTNQKTNWIESKTVTALIQGTIQDLKIAGFSYPGQEIEGKIIIEESLTPFDKKNPERHLKRAGETGIVCMQDGKPIYRRTRFSYNPDIKDKFVEHTNSEELSAAYNKDKADSAIKPNEEFTL
jgi:hypothetical protein